MDETTTAAHSPEDPVRASQAPLKRRDFLRNAAGFAFASGLPSSQTDAAVPVSYVPGFFTALEWAFVNAAVDRLIPADGNGPAAWRRGCRCSSTSIAAAPPDSIVRIILEGMQTARTAATPAQFTMPGFAARLHR